jgi:DnaJ-class molecular chaperone
LEIKVPAGINAGAYIKFAGKGNESTSHHVGDFYIQINIVHSRIYERKADNLYTKASVSLFDMVL